MNVKKIDSNKIKNEAKQFLNKLTKKAPLFFLFLILFYLFLGGILFYKYNILAQKIETWDIETKQNILKENSYLKILEHWDARKIKFDKIEETIYPDPFIKKTQPKPIEHEQEQILPIETEPSIEPIETKEETPAEVKEEQTAESFFGNINTLFDYYILQGQNFLPISKRAEIWEQEGLGETDEYHGFYNQNIKLLEELTK